MDNLCWYRTHVVCLPCAKWKWKWSRSVVSNSLRLMDCSPPDSSIHGILQARILAWRKLSAENWCFWTVNFWSILELKLLKYTSSICQPSGQIYDFSSSHVCMWELDCKESWVLKNWCFWTVVLEKTLESPLDYKVIQPVHPKGDQFWIFIGWTDAEAETPILWPSDVKNWLIGKDPDARNDSRWE